MAPPQPPSRQMAPPQPPSHRIPARFWAPVLVSLVIGIALDGLKPPTSDDPLSLYRALHKVSALPATQDALSVVLGYNVCVGA